MASMCLCSPTDHAGSFRCRLHRLSVQSMLPGDDSCSQVSSRGSCLCAPTSHPGSFRCRLHQTKKNCWGGRPIRPPADVSKPSCVSDLTPPNGAVRHGCMLHVPVGSSKRLLTKLQSESNKAMEEMASARDSHQRLLARVQSESNKEMASDQELQPNAVEAFEELRISDVVEGVAKKAKPSLALVCSTVSPRASEENQETSAHADLATAAKRNKEATSRSHRRPSVMKERRLRAKSGTSCDRTEINSGGPMTKTTATMLLAVCNFAGEELEALY